MAYGHVPRPAGSDPSTLRPRLYTLPQRAQTSQRQGVVIVPFNAQGEDQADYAAAAGAGERKALRPPKALVEYLAQVFNDELERGVTYPQRGPMDLAEFEGYFLGYDLLVGFFVSADQRAALAGASVPDEGLQVDNVAQLPDLSQLDFEQQVAGFFYVKPNYPGRSSHLCNGGFVVPPAGRGLGLGGVLGRSFLHFAPQAGYKGSVFNLVYVNNEASVKIWQRLGFTIVGRLPMAGLLKTESGEDELTDAYIIFKDFTGTMQDDKSAVPKALPTKTDDGTKDAA
ncbi:related to l-azetidine-2-carboxylic acid acetyltransferase [Sporisorium reilianum f. sp. reilianum]|uniref:Related to l-azetidine-2-carboxylic acid acetyltransferase n=1 Tax=Sporisorium reilianum f. sp. reilianum TaxID=72559 RepID=A0A2N8U5N1_9BASI|nr:related to l-azetidine-2-carboxylic acid acetyltransferase [Sporisorium reilianum f. sp. reilianum]